MTTRPRHPKMPRRHAATAFVSVATIANVLIGCANASPRAATLRPDAPATTRAADAPFDREAIAGTMRRVADRQLDRNAERGNRDANWIRATLYPGILATHDVTGDPTYLDATVRWAGEEGRWKIPGNSATQPAKSRRHADHQAIGWTYAELSRRLDEPAHRADVETMFDEVLAGEVAGREDWWWADALYMAPPTLTRMALVTGDPKYLHLNERLFWDTFDFLYDRDERLIYRDKNFFDRRVGGQKMFWSRGNGWTVGGLIRVIRDLPTSHPTRERYVTALREMCARLATLQHPDGLWRSNLLVPSQFPNPETSGTAFFVFAMAAGVNDGLLDRATFEPVVRRGWLGLMNCVLPDGTLGYVQPVGAGPGLATPTGTQEYGVGAFLLAAKEVIALGPPAPGTDSPPAPLPAYVAPPATKPTTKPATTRSSAARAHAMFVPERLDDFAWENDEVAFRAYGPALGKQDGPQSGIDIWVKRTPRLVQAEWYAKGDYHKDHGEGLDGYKVGGTRGCGGTSVIKDGKAFPSANFIAHRILENGPDRVVFELDYAAWNAGGTSVKETKRITLEPGTHFNKIESTFTFDGPPIDVAVGLKVHPQGQTFSGPKVAPRFIAAWEPVDGADNGDTGVAVIVPAAARLEVVEKDGDLLAVTTVKSGEPLTYHAGGGWSKDGFPDVASWVKHVERTAERLNGAAR